MEDIKTIRLANDMLDQPFSEKVINAVENAPGGPLFAEVMALAWAIEARSQRQYKRAFIEGSLVEVMQ